MVEDGEQMKVYRVKADLSRYQSFEPAQFEDFDTLSMDGTPRAAQWVPPAVYIPADKRKPGDFYAAGLGGIVLSQRAVRILQHHLDTAGELLPLPYNGQTFTVVNVTNCIDALDPNTSEFPYFWTMGFKGAPLSASRSPLFKVPETRMSEILLIEGLQAPEREFRHLVETAGLEGCLFTLLWTDES